MKSTVLIITGMHRSGTSLTASLFQSVGVNIGEKLIGPEYGNIRGHFEDIEFVELHKQILRSQHIDELGSNVEISEIPVKDEYLEAAKRLIENCQVKNEKVNKFWGWKDPRTTLFLSFWLRLLPDAKFIFVYRSPWEVVDSLYRRGTDKKLLEQPELAVKMWWDYNRRILDFYQQFSAQCLIGKVDTIGKNSEGFIEAVNEKFEIDLSAPPPGNFTESLLVKDISKTTKPGLIERYFPEALEVYKELEKIGVEEGVSSFYEVRLQKLEVGSEVSKVKDENLGTKNWEVGSGESKVKAEKVGSQKLEVGSEVSEVKDEKFGTQNWEVGSEVSEVKAEKLGTKNWEVGSEESKVKDEKFGTKNWEVGSGESKVKAEKVGSQKLEVGSEVSKVKDEKVGSQNLEVGSEESKVKAEKLGTKNLEVGSEESEIETKSELWEFRDWLNIRRLEKQNNLLEKQINSLETDVERWREIFREAQQKVGNLETELGETQQQLDNRTIKLQESGKKLELLETELGKTQVQLEARETNLQASQTKVVTLEKKLGQTQSQLENNQIKLQQSQTKIFILETDFGKTQAELDNSKTKFKEALTKISNLETNLGETQLQLDGTQIKLTESQEKIGILETDLGETQNQLQNQVQTNKIQLGESQEKIGILETKLGETQITLEETKAEILAMKSSKFWKLREKWFSWKGKIKKVLRSLQPRFVFSIDSPINWKFYNSQIEIVGWCFHNTLDIQNIRAKIGTEIFLGNYGIPRKDVAQLYEEVKIQNSKVKIQKLEIGSNELENEEVGSKKSNNTSTLENCGLEISAQLSSGNYQLILEAEDKKGKWQKFASYPISVSTVEANFDAPTNWEQREGIIFFAGWCCHPEQKITKLVLKCGGISVDCAYGLRRKDVGEVFPDWVGSEYSGFEVTVEVPSGKWEVSLEAYLENGEVVGFSCQEIFKLKRYSFWDKTQDKFQDLYKFSQALQKRVAERKQRLGRILPLPSEIPNIVRQILTIYREQQKLEGELLPPPEFVLPETIDVYDAWLAVNKWGDRSRQYLMSRLESCRTALPKISVVMPVYNPPLEFLRKGIASVQNQVYQNWEFCIADDCSSNSDVREILTEIAQTDSRIKLIFRSENGNISAATNSAAELATGDFILFMDNDDELTPDALGEVALYISENPETDFLYSDDDKITTEGKRFAPQFKPEYSPELLLSYMYMGHLCVVRKEIFDKVGGLRIGFEGSQDYDFALRATEFSRHVGHLPLVLYHWRTSPGSTAISGGEKPKSFLAGEKAVQESLIRRGIAGKVAQPDWAIRENLGIFKPTFPDQGDSVTIIIPTKNQAKLLKACIESLQKTTYQNYQVFVIDNESDESESLEYLASLKDLFLGEANVSVLPIPNNDGKFNFAAINNRAVERAKTEYILFLNNDTEVISSNWLSQMMGYAKIPGVGTVGAKLIYPDQRIQHAGVIHGLHHGLAGHAFKLLYSENRGYLSQAFVSRNYSAVTAACMLTPRKLFLDNGGFDEENFAVAYNDADYGYRLLRSGYRSVYCPDAELIHKEGTSRGYSDNPQEEANYRRKYSRMIDGFYSPHFSLESELFEIKPRRYFIEIEKSKFTSKKLENSSKESELNSQTLEENSANEPEIDVQTKVDNLPKDSQINSQTKFDISQKESELNSQTLEENSPNELEINVHKKVDNLPKDSQINSQTKFDISQKESELNSQARDCLFPHTNIKILMCSNSLDLTGAPLHQLEIALKLAKDGIIEPIIFCVSDGELREIYQQQNIQVIVKENPLEHIYQIDAYNAALTTFAEQIKSLNIDVMYINTLENFFMVDVAQMLNIPSVWNVHESQPWQTYFNRFGNEIAARALECFRYPYRIIFVADATRNRYLPLNSHHNFTVLHNGLDLELLKKAATKWSRKEARSTLGVQKDEIVILLLGTVCERKGQHDLVKSLSFIPEKEIEKIKCFIVGDRPNLYSLKLHELVKNLPEEVQKKVEIVGETPDTAKYYQAADIFVCTSRIESFPRVILEAMAYNLPIVTTPVFGIVEQVKPNINGLFYTPENPEELANVLTSLLIDEELRQRFANNAKYVLESLNTFAEMTETYGEIFQEAYFSLDKLAHKDYTTAHKDLGTDTRIN
ncbi:glycosyltransferase [Okeania sp.]|uniref:glycosyltransferase n=1 Tax=Okeania sp. TaxID=3100323 RepID=UPI002B4AF78C|nr:glycosyltransferase [Okeania sp.]MEB3342686.1 glycosyltransferase [Okeania sp.]